VTKGAAGRLGELKESYRSHLVSAPPRRYPAPAREVAAFAPYVALTGQVLELGCGDGRLTFAYAGQATSIIALDPDRKAIRRARTEARRRGMKRIRFLVGTAERPPRTSIPFDLVLFSSSL
jgi:ubiquinone/menaquinone biosynthesis C-methylase UbiE